MKIAVEEIVAGGSGLPSHSCPCRAVEETGRHLVFECPRFEAIRADFLGGKDSWEELDQADWRKIEEGDDTWYFEVEEFFGHQLYGEKTEEDGR